MNWKCWNMWKYVSSWKQIVTRNRKHKNGFLRFPHLQDVDPERFIFLGTFRCAHGTRCGWEFGICTSFINMKFYKFFAVLLAQEYTELNTAFNTIAKFTWKKKQLAQIPKRNIDKTKIEKPRKRNAQPQTRNVHTTQRNAKIQNNAKYNRKHRVAGRTFHFRILRPLI